MPLSARAQPMPDAGMHRKGETIRPRFQRTGCFEKQADIGDVGGLCRAGPQLFGQRQQGPQIFE